MIYVPRCFEKNRDRQGRHSIRFTTAGSLRQVLSKPATKKRRLEEDAEAEGMTKGHRAPSSILVTTSKALVTRSDALVPNSFLLLLRGHRFQ